MRMALVATVGFLVLPFSALSQSDFVVFRNDVLTGPNRLVLGSDAMPLVGTNYMAQLLIGASPDSLVPVAVPAPARFRAPGTPLPGTWVGYNVSVPLAPGTEVYMQVRVWDSNFGLTFDQACALNQAGLLPVFTWTVPGSMAPIEDHYMQGFVGGIPVPCPEPSVVALFFLAVPVLALWRVRRRIRQS
jgi:hypothetical protein